VRHADTHAVPIAVAGCRTGEAEFFGFDSPTQNTCRSRSVPPLILFVYPISISGNNLRIAISKAPYFHTGFGLHCWIVAIKARLQFVLTTLRFVSTIFS
jgi:hypothetical protein